MSEPISIVAQLRLMARGLLPCQRDPETLRTAAQMIEDTVRGGVDLRPASMRLRVLVTRIRQWEGDETVDETELLLDIKQCLESVLEGAMDSYGSSKPAPEQPKPVNRLVARIEIRDNAQMSAPSSRRYVATFVGTSDVGYGETIEEAVDQMFRGILDKAVQAAQELAAHGR